MSAVLEIIVMNTDDDYAVLSSFMTWLDNSGEQDFWDATGKDCIHFEYDYRHKRIIMTNICAKAVE